MHGGCPYVVYGPQEDNEKIQFMEEPSARRLLYPGPWFAIGDFNLILQATDKNNASFDRRMMSKFRRCIDDNGLKELFCMDGYSRGVTKEKYPLLPRLTRRMSR